MYNGSISTAIYKKKKQKPESDQTKLTTFPNLINKMKYYNSKPFKQNNIILLCKTILISFLILALSLFKASFKLIACNVGVNL